MNFNRGHRDWIAEKRKEWVGKKVTYEEKQYTVVDVDYNGALLIDKPAQFTDTTAIGMWMITYYYGITKIEDGVNTVSDWFDNLDDAITKIKTEWKNLTAPERENIESFYVGKYYSKDSDGLCADEDEPYIIKKEYELYEDMWYGVLDENGDLVPDEYEYLGRFSSGYSAAWEMRRRGYSLDEIQQRGIYTEDECVFGYGDLI